MRNGDCELLVIGERRRICGEDVKGHVFMHKHETFAIHVRASNPCLAMLHIHGWKAGVYPIPSRNFIKAGKIPPLTAFTYDCPPPEHDEHNRLYGIIKATFMPINEENMNEYIGLTGVVPIIDSSRPVLDAPRVIRMHMALDDPRRFERRRAEARVSHET